MNIGSLTVIGGASAYMPGLMAAILHRAANLALREVRLHDIDASRLKCVERLCARMAQATGTGIRVWATMELVEAVKGVNAVLNSARPGGFRCRRIDETLPLEFGIPGQETVGPGGFFFALRSVPQAVQLAETMEDHAPHSILLNYTNPTNIVTQAILDRSRIPVIGLCDQSVDDLATLARATGHAGRLTRFRCTGLNHATWYADIAYDGVPWRAGADGIAAPPDLDEEHRLRFEVCRRIASKHPGRWPNSYLAYYEDPAAFVALARRRGPRSDAIVASLEGYYRHFAAEAARPQPVLRHHRGAKEFGDMAVDVVEALGGGPRRIALNVPNHGMIADLEPETVVEVVTDVDASGVHPIEAPPLPAGETGWIRALERYQRAAAAAACGDEDPVAALAANPLVGDRRCAERLIARARACYGDACPGLHPAGVRS